MAKETFADKIAKKTFDSPDFQKSWTVHMQAFGPILKPAFDHNYQARIHLTAALNLISKRDINGGLKKLQSLKDSCTNDADKAALLFFMGVCFEMAGRQEQMLECYTYANEYGHRFYMPYLKVAKWYLNGHLYDKAEENFRAAIECFQASGLDAQDRLILGSAYTNLANCLTMMHHYDEAESALSTSRSLYPGAPGRAAVEAVLYAIRGNTEQLDVCFATLKAHAPDAYDAIKATTDKILSHTDPLFYPVPVDNEKIASFWKWFAEYESTLQNKLERQEYEAAITPVAEHLLDAFPFLEEQPYISLGQNEAGYVLELKDMYAVAVMDAYDKLLQACPEAIQSRWQFVVVH